MHMIKCDPMIKDAAPTERQSSLVRLPGGIWALGLVSLFMDISSEMILVFGLSIAFAASSFFLSFFSFGGGVVI
jgi:hypothetical protein